MLLTDHDQTIIRSDAPTDTDWLAEVVTEEAKRDPDWRAKAMIGRGAISACSQVTPRGFQSS